MNNKFLIRFLKIHFMFVSLPVQYSWNRNLETFYIKNLVKNLIQNVMTWKFKELFLFVA